MRYIDFDQNTGQVLGDYHSSDFIPKGSVLELDVEFGYAFECFIEQDELIKIPPQPNEFSVFDYNLKQWVDTRTAESQWGIIRTIRSELLYKSDWTQLPDVPISTKELWASYRQALRDITLQQDPFNIQWPIAPSI